MNVSVLLWAALAPSPSQARSLIRDAEIEHTLRLYADPIFKSAGLSPDAIHIFLIDDKSINAFVAGGSNMFLHTGLILETKDPGMLIGVMAHETGHIAGGHLAQGSEKIKNAQLGTVLSYILGAAAAAGGSPKAGMAIMSAGQQAAMRNFLSYSRANEQSADQAGLTYLQSNNISANGMLEMFELLRRNESRNFGTPDPYVLTHPLGKERIAHIRNYVSRSTIPPNSWPKAFNGRHERMIAKLTGFLQPLDYTLTKYPTGNNGLSARYARAIAYYRASKLDISLVEMDSLLKESPADPFFNELKGQILFENGKVDEALKSYSTAVKLLPDSPLIRIDLAKAQLAVGTPDMISEAQQNLEIATSQDATNASAWRLLGTAYGKQNKMAQSNLALAEEAVLINEPEQALNYLRQAEIELKAGSPGSLRAQDLKRLAEKMKKDKEEEE